MPRKMEGNSIEANAFKEIRSNKLGHMLPVSVLQMMDIS